jgi:hypothetical protein
MAGKNGSDAGQSWSTPFFGFGPGQTEAATALQKELLEAYEKASHAWLTRVQSEVAMWSELATKLTATRSVPEALETYSKCVSKRMQMAAEDGRRLFNEGQQIAQKINGSLTSGWPTASR